MGQLKSNETNITVNNNECLIDASEQLGVNFGCQNGTCGACLTIVTDGMDRLTPLSENESQFGLDDNERLMCQCKIQDGDVTIDV